MLEGLEIGALRQMVLDKLGASETRVHFRNLEKATAGDLAALLADIEYLDAEEENE